MDNLIFCLNATVPIFVLIILGKLLQRWHFFSPATMKDMDNLVFKLLLPISLFRSISSNSIAEQFDLRFFLFCFCATLLSLDVYKRQRPHRPQGGAGPPSAPAR